MPKYFLSLIFLLGLKIGFAQDTKLDSIFGYMDIKLNWTEKEATEKLKAKFLSYDSTNGTTEYTVANPEYLMFDACKVKLQIVCFDDKLMAIEITPMNYSDSDLLLQVATKVYGQPKIDVMQDDKTKATRKLINWQSSRVVAMYSQTEDTCFALTIANKAITFQATLFYFNRTMNTK